MTTPKPDAVLAPQAMTIENAALKAEYKIRADMFEEVAQAAARSDTLHDFSLELRHKAKTLYAELERAASLTQAMVRCPRCLLQLEVGKTCQYEKCAMKEPAPAAAQQYDVAQVRHFSWCNSNTGRPCNCAPTPAAQQGERSAPPVWFNSELARYSYSGMTKEALWKCICEHFQQTTPPTGERPAWEFDAGKFVDDETHRLQSANEWPEYNLGKQLMLIAQAAHAAGLASRGEGAELPEAMPAWFDKIAERMWTDDAFSNEEAWALLRTHLRQTGE